MPTAEPARDLTYSSSLPRPKGDGQSPTGISPTHTDKRIINGIEVLQEIVYLAWEPGHEYIRNIVLKNVGVKSQKIRFSAPKTRFFSTLYPKPLSLSAGTSFALPITFRPLEKVVYHDAIKFTSKEGDFEVALLAELPKSRIRAPDSLDFDMCAAHDSTSLTFTVTNIGDMDTALMWSVAGPFTIEPMEGFLKRNASCQFTATFSPLSASVFELGAICAYGTEKEMEAVVTMKGIGKYPHLLVSTSGKPASNLCRDQMEAVASFGCEPVGSKNTKWLELHNLSPVRVPFTVEHPGGINLIDRVFGMPRRSGIVPPNSAFRIPVTFHPNSVDTTSIDYFHVIAVGNISKSVIKCMGSSKGPVVHLSTDSINFMQINTGEQVGRTVDIINTSSIDAVFQLMIDCNESVFRFKQVCGVVKAESRVILPVVFVPSAPINFYRRVTCLIHNQGPLYLDLLGTCHSEQMKPSVLLSKHIKRFQTHAARGLSYYAPEQLNQLLHDDKLLLDKDGCLYTPSDENPAVFSPATPFEEYFNDGFHSDVVSCAPHVSTDIHVVDFGKCLGMNNPEERTVNITNHTNGKVIVQWTNDPDHVFSILQPNMEIPPLKTCSFRIKFKPTAPNKLFGAELECYVYYKILRDYRMVEDTTHFPPWCLTVTCTGHTFQPNNEPFLPQYALDSSAVVFPAVNTKECAFRTVVMTNTGAVPILYHLKPDPSNIFAAKPAQGLLKAGFQIFVVRMLPDRVQTFKHNMVMRLNDHEKFDQTLQLFGSAESPQILLDAEGCMFFKPTCVGMSSVQTYTIKNISRIPLRFEWHLKYADSRQLSVHPDTGLIAPYESQSQSWAFKPSSQGKFVMKPSLIVWGQGFSSGTSGGKKKEFPIRVLGEGSFGTLHADQSYFDLGDVVVGTSLGRSITLYNNSPCALMFRLLVDLETQVAGSEMQIRENKQGLELDKTSGTIPARSKVVIGATVRPLRRLTYHYCVSYQLLTPAGTVSDSAVYEPQHLFHLLMTGVYPTLAVTDARCEGSLAGISKKLLWSLFSLDSLNECLDADPSCEELMYQTATRHSLKRRIPVYTRAILDFNFSAAPLGCEPSRVTLMIENTGTVPTEWAFLFPCDLHLELQYWAETGEFDEDELHEMKVMDNKLFSIHPRKGTLAPGATQNVNLTYSHILSGTDRLPVLLKIARGRELLLNFIGVTVEHYRRYIHFPSNKHMFTPVPVGERTSPIQMYELFNGGAMPVQYELDLTPLDIVQKENFDQPIFECLNPVGEIPAGRSVLVQWRFSPLEAKTYMVDIPIRVKDGETAIVTFTGVGYDRRIMGDSMPLNDAQDLTGVPCIQSIALPGQLAHLSLERVSFGNLPLFSQSRRMVFLNNKSSSRPISFHWHVTSQADSQLLLVNPVKGQVNPEESVMCRVTFVAKGMPSFYDLDLICEVLDEVEVGRYKEHLRAWEAELERQQVEFTITEHDLKADQRAPHITSMVEITRPRSGHLTALSYTASPSQEHLTTTEISKYRTLPPIQVMTADEGEAVRKKMRQQRKELWLKPSPPKPLLLHLGLTARTHDMQHFQEYFPHNYFFHYINRLANEGTKGLGTQPPIPQQITCLQNQAHLITSILSNVIKSLLDDAYFVSAVKKVMSEPVPYFAQYSTRVRPPPSPSPSQATLTEDTESQAMDSNTEIETDAEMKGDMDPGTDGEEAELVDEIAGETQAGKDAQDGVRQRSSSGQEKLTEGERQKSRESVKRGSTEQRSMSAEKPSTEIVEVRSTADQDRLNEIERQKSADAARRSSTATQERSIDGERRGSAASRGLIDGERQRSVDGQEHATSIPSSQVSIQGSGSEKLKPAVDPVLAIEDIPQKECQILKKLPEFGNMLEQLLENTVVNIFSEALAGDFNLTARRRFLALPKYTPPLINPPSRSKSTDWTNRSHEAMTEATSKLTQDSSKATVLSPKQAASKSSVG